MRKICFIIMVALLVGLFPRLRTQNLDAAPSAVQFTRIGKASWYSNRSPGIKHRTANNEVFNDKALTCAMWGVEFGRQLKVTNLANGKSVTVRVNDRGPSGRYVRQGRIIDLTKAAFSKLTTTKNGIISVKVEFL